jgi:hypothetical protein
VHVDVGLEYFNTSLDRLRNLLTMLDRNQLTGAFFLLCMRCEEIGT